MSIEAIGAIGASDQLVNLSAPAVQQPAAGGFTHWFAQEVGEVNRAIMTSQEGVSELAAGRATSLHDVMIHMEEAKLSFQLLAQVRNRLLDAYQEVMRTQV
jgi:flagellar hook-basal body complex protein FliE